MAIKGLDIAVKHAIERARRTKLTICIVQIGENDYVLWRDINKEALALEYRWYKIVKVIGYKDDFRY